MKRIIVIALLFISLKAHSQGGTTYTLAHKPINLGWADNSGFVTIRGKLYIRVASTGSGIDSVYVPGASGEVKKMHIKDIAVDLVSNQNIYGIKQFHSGVSVGGIFDDRPISGDPPHVFNIVNDASIDGTKYTYQQTVYSPDGGNSNFHVRKSRGTYLSPQPILSGDFMWSLGARGFDGTGFAQSSAAIQIIASENFSTTNNGTEMVFSTTTNGNYGANRNIALKLENNGYGTFPVGVYLGNNDGNAIVTRIGNDLILGSGSNKVYLRSNGVNALEVGNSYVRLPVVPDNITNGYRILVRDTTDGKIKSTLVSALFNSTNITNGLGYTPYDPASYPVNSGGETFQSVVSRGNIISGDGGIFYMQKGTSAGNSYFRFKDEAGVNKAYMGIFGASNNLLIDAGAADINITGASINLDGVVKIITNPTTSAGSHDILTRNTSTGVVEKISSSSLLRYLSKNYTDAGSAIFPTLSDVYSYTLPANTLSADGHGLDLFYSGVTAANGNTKNIQFIFGGYTFNFGSLTTSGLKFIINIKLIRSSSSTALAVISLKQSNSGAISQETLTTESLTGLDFTTTNTVKLTSTGGATDDIVFKMGTIKFEPAP